MLTNLQKFYRPETIEEALKALALGKGKNVLVAGSTYLGVSKNRSITGLVDISGLKLNSVSVSRDELRVGAGLTISALLKAKGLSGFAAGLVNKACDTLGATPLRNMITVGGNFAIRLPWSNLPVAFLVLDTEISAVTGSGEKHYSLPEFLKTKMAEDEIITEIKAKISGEGYRYDFIKFSRTDFDYPLFNLAAAYKIEDKKFSDVRIAVGRITAAIMRLEALENRLKGQKADKETVSGILERLSEDIKIVPDYRASKEYRLEMLRVNILKALVK